MIMMIHDDDDDDDDDDVLFCEMLKELQLSDTVPPWYSLVVPKPIYESPKAQAYRDI